MSERIQKLLSRAGYGSRREIERWVQAGEITVNGKIATTGQAVDETDKIILRGQVLHLANKLKAKPQVLLYHKKAGEICTRKDPEGRPTVFDNITKLKNGRWVCVGRLDINSSGLLIFTNHGELANRLMHPSSEVEREYAVRVQGEDTPAILQKLQNGVMLEDGLAKFDSIVDAGGQGSNHWYHVVLREGKNREVRRIWQSQDIRVSRLIRVRYANIVLPRNLSQRKRVELTLDEIKSLFELVDLPWVDREAGEDKAVQTSANAKSSSHSKTSSGRTRSSDRGRNKKSDSRRRNRNTS